MVAKGIVSLLAASLMISTSGCAVIFTGSGQIIPVTSSPSGAKVEVDGLTVGNTPTQISVKRGSNHRLQISMEGYETIYRTIGQKLNGWFILDIALLNFLSIIIDIATGAWKWATPEFINVTLRPKK